MLWIPLTLFGIMVPPVVTLSVFQATNAELPGWLQDVQTAGVIGMFVMLFFCLLTKRLVMGWTYDAMVTERDYYRGIAYKTTELADRQVSTAEEMLKRMDTLALRSEVLEGRERRRHET